MSGDIILLIDEKPVKRAEYFTKQHRQKVIDFWYCCYGERMAVLIRPRVRKIKTNYGHKFIHW